MLGVLISPASAQIDCFTEETPARFVNRVEADYDIAVLFLRSEVDNKTSMGIVFISDDWQWLQTDTIYFIIDGQRFEGTLFTVDREIMDSGRVSEVYAVFERVNPKMFNAFKTANTVEFKTSDDSFAFTTELIEDYKKLTHQQ